MPKYITLRKAYLIAAIMVWLALVLVSFQYAHQYANNVNTSSWHSFLNNFLLSLFFVLILLYHKIRVNNTEELNISDTLWNAFVRVGIMFSGITVTRLFTHSYDNPAIVNAIYDINIMFIGAYLAKLFYAFKRMILYQKTKRLIQFWNVFEYTTFASLLLTICDVPFFHPLSLSLLGLLSIMALILSLNLKWIAYLSTKQKWKNLLIVFLTLLISASFLQYIYYESSTLNNEITHYLINDLSQVTLVNAMFIFLIFYAVSSILVLFFNVPTSSVFEKKAKDVFNYQKLSHSIRFNQNEQEIIKITFETSYSTAMAEAAWIEVFSPEGQHKNYHTYHITEAEITELKTVLLQSNCFIDTDEVYLKNTKKIPAFKQLDSNRFKSIFSIPISFQDKPLGILCISKGIEDGLSMEIRKTIHSFVNQAGVSIENSRLMNKAIENERYQEEIKIAKQVQSRLIPNQLGSFPCFDITAFSKSADEVGGDYFDIYKISESKTAVVIGDVSGHGTSAAFNMAQLKGIFQSLIRVVKSPEEFMFYANDILSECLDKRTFVTLTLYFICNETKTISLVRAGHCPSLFYSKNEDKSFFFDNKGLGLGIVRNESYKNFISPFTKHYASGDVLLIYTDGIVEAKNKLGEEYGFDRLRTNLHGAASYNVNEILTHLLEDVHAFCNQIKIDDDYTCLVIKFS